MAFLAAGLLAVAASPASAGQTGDVKVRSGPPSLTETDNKNESHVCQPFHLHGFNFTNEPTGVWAIYVWNPTDAAEPLAINQLALPSPAVATGTWNAIEWQTDSIAFADDGHYKVFWQAGNTDFLWPPNATPDLEGMKHKEFWVACHAGGTANISIGPTAVNDIGAGKTSHTFIVTLTGSAVLSSVNITVNVTPAPTTQSDTCATPTVVDSQTLTCTLTITSPAPAGPFTATASAAGLVGGQAFVADTDGSAGNSGAATKEFACLTHPLTLSVTGAGKSATSYTNFTTNVWTILFEYTVDGGTTWTALPAPTVTDGGPANVTFSTTGSVPTASPYTATVNWRWTVKTVLGNTTIFSSGTIGNISLTNTGDCKASDGAVSPVSNPQVTKKRDSIGNGTLPVIGGGLANWFVTATNGSTTLTSNATSSLGTATILGLDDLLSWQICETQQTGWYQTYPAASSTVNGEATDSTRCYTRGVASTVGNYTFGNFEIKDLAISKTVSTSFKRTYNWSINKSVDKTLVEQNGGTATFNYTVTVTQNGYTDSDWVVSGTISVVNPNPFAISGVTVSDSLANCTVTGGSNATIPAFSNGTTFAYTCSPASGDAGTNTATAAWDGPANQTPNSSVTSALMPFSFVTPSSTVNSSVTVTDTFNAVTTTLGIVTAIDSQTPTDTQFKYSHTVTVNADRCDTYTNTAKITETNATSPTITVKVCGAVKGALTIGFWQNKNGQGIITGGASTTGVCNSGTYLRTYAPFQDLSATATCSQVASYVYSLIKAANASGSSMNAMLKAQMLATALDVYFSDPALGGNKINAPVPLGGVKIDLTQVCKMIDGTGGTATCSGTYQNVSSAFGGATALTISDILAYAASQSNSGGSTWYGQVKATQELAKNTFDAINNNVALVAP